jgi:thermitase
VAGSATIQSAAQYLKNKGGLMFVSAGNNGIDENITPTPP